MKTTSPTFEHFKPVKVLVTGTRGIPHVPGGIESHCEQLYTQIAKSDQFRIYVTIRPYYQKEYLRKWKNIQLIPLWAPKIKNLETIVHTFLSVLKAKQMGVDLVHIHAVGPGLLIPLARILGLKTIFTNHGPDYKKQKWNFGAQLILRLGEYFGSRFAHQTIVISNFIQNNTIRKYGIRPALIYNGVLLPSGFPGHSLLDQYGLIHRRFILSVARFSPEKGLDLLIEAYQRSAVTDFLVIVGDADFDTAYTKKLKGRIKNTPGVIWPGYLTGKALEQFFFNARLFILPSLQEGLPIVLLEAMSYGLMIVASDIPAHKEIGLPNKSYFTCGDVKSLSDKIKLSMNETILPEEKQWYKKLIDRKYNWEKISEKTLKIYKTVLEK